MATLFEYKCKKCGYSINANPKGHDMIMSGELYSYLCEDWGSWGRFPRFPDTRGMNK